jgi:hypothetical protein
MTSGVSEVVSRWRSYIEGRDPSYRAILSERQTKLFNWARWQGNFAELTSLFESIQDTQISASQRIERAIRVLKISKPMIGFGAPAVAAVKGLLLDQSQDDLLIAFDQLYGLEAEVNETKLLATPFEKLVEGYQELLAQNPTERAVNSKYAILATVLMTFRSQKLPQMVVAWQKIAYNHKLVNIIRDYDKTDDRANALVGLNELSEACEAQLASSSLSLLNRCTLMDRKTQLGSLKVLFIFAEHSLAAKEELKDLIANALNTANTQTDSSLQSIFSTTINALCDCFGYLKA